MDRFSIFQDPFFGFFSDFITILKALETVDTDKFRAFPISLSVIFDITDLKLTILNFNSRLMNL